MLDIQSHTSADDDDSEPQARQLSFREWFRGSVACVYAERVPETLRGVCDELEIEDPWVSYLLTQAK